MSRSLLSLPAIGVVLACLGLLACNPRDATPAPYATYDQIQVVETAIEEAGGDGARAGAGVLMALDRGYSIRTVVAALSEDRFRSRDGTVLSTDGGVLSPEGPDTGVFSDKPEMMSQAALVPARLYRASAGGDVQLQAFMSELAQDLDFLDLGLGPGAPPPPERQPHPWENLTRAEAMDRARVMFITSLAANGYSVEQIVESIVFGQPIGCAPNLEGSLYAGRPVSFQCRILGEEPALRPDPVFRGDTASQTPATPSVAPTETEGHRFVGEASISANPRPGDRLLRNSVDLVAGETLSGTIEVLTQAQGSGEGETGCAYVRVEIPDLPQSSSGSGHYEGTVTTLGAWTDTLCPDGGPPPTQPGRPVAISASIEGDILSGSFGDMTFRARRQ